MLLEVKNLKVKYGEITALHGVSLSAEEGKLTTLLGSNGAGKSTLVKALSGQLKPASGEVIFNGEDITGKSTHEIVKRGIIQCPEGRRVFPQQSVYENLKMGAFTRSDKKEIEEDIEKYFDLFPVLRERKNQKAGLLSGGEQQMLALSRALMARPKLLMLDEPSMGLAPIIVKEVFSIVETIKQSGTTMLLIEQNAKQALKISDYCYILDIGRIVTSNDAQSLLNDETVQRAYFGCE